jgi:hypothetical protein
MEIKRNDVDRGRDADKSDKERKHKKKSKRHRSRSPSSSSSSDSSSAARRKRRKERKKAKKEKNDINNMSITDRWGMRGILRDEDMYTKEPEFRAWLQEIKRIAFQSLSHYQIKDLWGEFSEDFNTITLAHEKYYDISAFEEAERRKAPNHQPDDSFDYSKVCFLKILIIRTSETQSCKPKRIG